MAKPFVSVLIDTYNHERFIHEAVASVLAQDYPASQREILVVDDGSTDRTPEVLREFESQVRILRKPNGGQASAFNYAIPHCRDEIVAFLDGDDWWAPNKLSTIVDAFSSNPSVGLVGHGITEVLADGTQRSELVHQTHHVRLDSVAGARTFRLRKSFLGTSRMACRGELLRRIASVPEALVFEADEYIFTLGALLSDVLILREPLTFYRLHDKNLFQVSDGDKSSLRRKQDVLDALTAALRKRFAEENVPADIANTVLESLETESDILRLAIDGGSSLDTIRLELRSYRIMHEDASPFRRLLKYASLAPALFLGSRRYASLKQTLAANPLIRKTRQRVLPTLQPSHVERTGRWRAP